MSSPEYNQLLDDLPGLWQTSERFNKRDEYIKRLRQSSLSADDIGRLRDSLVLDMAGPIGRWVTTIRGMLQGVYEERLRKEGVEAKPWIIRYLEKHPTLSIFVWIIVAIVTVVIMIIVTDWWVHLTTP